LAQSRSRQPGHGGLAVPAGQSRSHAELGAAVQRVGPNPTLPRVAKRQHDLRSDQDSNSRTHKEGCASDDVMQVARAFVPITPSGPSSHDPRRCSDGEDNGSGIDRNNHKGHAREIKAVLARCCSVAKGALCEKSVSAVSPGSTLHYKAATRRFNGPEPAKRYGPPVLGSRALHSSSCWSITQTPFSSAPGFHRSPESGQGPRSPQCHSKAILSPLCRDHLAVPKALKDTDGRCCKLWEDKVEVATLLGGLAKWRHTGFTCSMGPGKFLGPQWI